MAPPGLGAWRWTVRAFVGELLRILLQPVDFAVSKYLGMRAQAKALAKEAYKLIAELICREMNCAVGPATDFILDHILIYSVVSSTIRFIIGELDVGVQSFLQEISPYLVWLEATG